MGSKHLIITPLLFYFTCGFKLSSPTYLRSGCIGKSAFLRYLHERNTTSTINLSYCPHTASRPRKRKDHSLSHSFLHLLWSLQVMKHSSQENIWITVSALFVSIYTINECKQINIVTTLAHWVSPFSSNMITSSTLKIAIALATCPARYVRSSAV